MKRRGRLCSVWWQLSSSLWVHPHRLRAKWVNNTVASLPLIIFHCGHEWAMLLPMCYIKCSLRCKIIFVCECPKLNPKWFQQDCVITHRLYSLNTGWTDRSQHPLRLVDHMFNEQQTTLMAAFLEGGPVPGHSLRPGRLTGTARWPMLMEQSRH